MESSIVYATQGTVALTDIEPDRNAQALINLLGGANAMIQLPALNKSFGSKPTEPPASVVDDDADEGSISQVIERDKQVARRTHDFASLVMNYGATLSDPYFASPVPMTDRSRYLMDYREFHSRTWYSTGIVRPNTLASLRQPLPLRPHPPRLLLALVSYRHWGLLPHARGLSFLPHAQNPRPQPD